MSKRKTKEASIQWVRLSNHDIKHASDLNVDVERITKMLNDRWEAKQSRKFEIADNIASELREMNICYHDDLRSWYTFDGAIKNRTATETNVSTGSKTKSKAQIRNRRQAEKNRRKKLQIAETSEEMPAQNDFEVPTTIKAKRQKL